MYTKRYTFAKTLLSTLLIAGAGFANAGTVTLPGGIGGDVAVSLQSITESTFEGVIRQQFDFSCGSAALATVLTHHYEFPVSEEEVFSWMFENGDQKKIRQLGFSMLDMKNYLADKGLKADGFKISMAKFAGYRVPGIALIDTNGYKHFVVIKGIDEEKVLLGDPALGVRVVSREDFDKQWAGIVFVVRSQANVGRFYFNRTQDWGTLAGAPMRTGVDAASRGSIADFTLSLPQAGDF